MPPSDKTFPVELSAVSIGERSASVTVTRKLCTKNPEAHVGVIWRKFSKRRLSGTLYVGDDKPEQSNFGDRITVAGVFDTGQASFKTETASFKVSFDHGEIDAEDLIKLSFKKCWLVIDSNKEQPAPEKPEKKKAKPLAWQTQSITELGIDDRVAAKFTNNGVKHISDVIAVLAGEHKEQSIESLKLTQKQVVQTTAKADLFFDDIGVVNPMST